MVESRMAEDKDATPVQMAKVISIRDGKERRLQESMPLKTVRNARMCLLNHRRAVEVDPHGRTLKCVDCGAPLDPFDYVEGLSRDCDWVVYMRREKEDLQKEIAMLKEERSKLRASVRESKKRVEKKAVTCAKVGG